MADLVEIDSARENRMLGMLLHMHNQTGFWTGGIVRHATQCSSMKCSRSNSQTIQIRHLAFLLILSQSKNDIESWLFSQILEANFMIWHGSQQQMTFDNSLDKSVAVDSPKGNI